MRFLVDINCPVTVAFDYLADGRTSRDFLDDSFTLTPEKNSPYQLGSRATAVGNFSGFSFTQAFEVVTFQYGRIVRLRSISRHSQFDSEVTWKLEPLAENKCRIGLELKLAPRNLFVAALAAPITHEIQKRVDAFGQQSLRRLKQRLEARVAEQAA